MLWYPSNAAVGNATRSWDKIFEAAISEWCLSNTRTIRLSSNIVLHPLHISHIHYIFDNYCIRIIYECYLNNLAQKAVIRMAVSRERGILTEVRLAWPLRLSLMTTHPFGDHAGRPLAFITSSSKVYVGTYLVRRYIQVYWHIWTGHNPQET